MYTTMPLIKGTNARDAQNANVLGELSSTGECVDALVRHGYTVLRIEIKDTKSVVWIQACPHCAKLLGAWYRIECGPQGRLYTWQASLLGCKVQWQTKEVWRGAGID